MAPVRIRAQSFDPDSLHALFTAFDIAWKSVEARIEPRHAKSTRDRIALAIMCLASTGETNIERLANHGVAHSGVSMPSSKRPSRKSPRRLGEE